MDPTQQIEEWFYSYGDDVYNFLIYYTGSKDVEDYVQEVFLRAFKSFSTYEERANPKTWLFTIARNLVVDKSRRKKLLKFFSFDLLPLKSNPIDFSSPEETILKDEMLFEIHNTIHTLKQTYKDVLLSRLILELSVEETATILGWSPSKVNLTFHRALKALQKKLVINESEAKVHERTQS
ncbi:RNA polymerase sigma factor [Fredinandcohnia humi]